MKFSFFFVFFLFDIYLTQEQGECSDNALKEINYDYPSLEKFLVSNFNEKKAKEIITNTILKSPSNIFLDIGQFKMTFTLFFIAIGCTTEFIIMIVCCLKDKCFFKLSDNVKCRNLEFVSSLIIAFLAECACVLQIMSTLYVGEYIELMCCNAGLIPSKIVFGLEEPSTWVGTIKLNEYILQLQASLRPIENNYPKIFGEASGYNKLKHSNQTFYSLIQETKKYYTSIPSFSNEEIKIYPSFVSDFQFGTNSIMNDLKAEYERKILAELDLIDSLKEQTEIMYEKKNEIIESVIQFSQSVKGVNKTISESNESLENSSNILKLWISIILIQVTRVISGLLIVIIPSVATCIVLYIKKKYYTLSLILNISWMVISFLCILMAITGGLFGVFYFKVKFYLTSYHHSMDEEFLKNLGNETTFNYRVNLIQNYCLNDSMSFSSKVISNKSLIWEFDKYYKYSQKIYLSKILNKVSTSEVAEKKLKELEKYKNKIELSTENLKEDDISNILFDINSKTKGGNCGTMHLYVLRDDGTCGEALTEEFVNDGVFRCFLIQKINESAISYDNCAEIPNKIKKAKEYINRIQTLLENTTSFMKTVNEKYEEVYNFTYETYLNTQTITKEMNSSVRDIVGEEGSFFDILNCNFFKKDAMRYSYIVYKYIAPQIKIIQDTCVFFSLSMAVLVFLIPKITTDFSLKAELLLRNKEIKEENMKKKKKKKKKKSKKKEKPKEKKTSKSKKLKIKNKELTQQNADVMEINETITNLKEAEVIQIKKKKR